jgi:hypothetical protein
MAHALRNNSSRSNHSGFFSVCVCALCGCCLIAILAAQALAQSHDDQNKGLDVKSSAGDMHLGNDADSHQVGLPVYPGARERKHDENRSNANLSLFTSAFGMKLVVLNYDSDDAPEKVIAFYRQKLKKYGKVLECRTTKHDAGVDVNQDSDDSKKSKELKCEGDQKGDTIELKAGTEDDQHIVAISPADNGGKGSNFELVYVHTRGKQADI